MEERIEAIEGFEEAFILEEDFEKERGQAAASTKYCLGTVTNTSAGNWCNSSECNQRYMNKKLHYECDGEDCPIQANNWYMVVCESGGQKYLSGCKVFFGSVDPCT